LLLLAVPSARGAGLESYGNADGVLTWRLGTLEGGASAREVVFFLHAASADALARALEEARAAWAREDAVSGSPAARLREAGCPAEPAPEAQGAADSRGSLGQPRAWIENGATDFALEGPGFFRWRMERQALRSERGGQLSQFTYYIHYYDAAGEHRAGIPHVGESELENLRVLDAARVEEPGDAESAAPPRQASALVETLDGKLRLRVRARMGRGPLVAVEFLFENVSSEPLRHLRLTVYANLESAHDEGNDASFLDRRTGSVLVVDPPTGIAVAVAGLHAPWSGYSGTWNSLPQLQAAAGIPYEEWKAFEGVPAEIRRRLERESAGARGIYLPFVHEHPSTPETRALAEAEAEAALERDWLFQAMGRPLRERALEEIGWARELAKRIAARERPPDLAADLAELERLEAELAAASAGDPETSKRLHFAVRRAKRRIFLRNPAIDFDRLLAIDQPYPRGPVNDTHEAIHRMGITATPGGRLLLLGGLGPDAKVRKLAPEKPGSFWGFDLSFDGERVVFSYKPYDEKSFHLYEVRLDGTGLRQLTSSDYDDIDPIHVPDGAIVFTTTRGNSHVRCGPFIYSYVLARCAADGSEVYLLSSNGEPDFVPSVLEDGRVIYSRWEYTDKPLWRIQSLWTANPDGTGTAAFWGNQSVWPDHLSEPRQIPGTRRAIFSGVGHHDWFSGSIGIVDIGKGLNFPDGLTKVTADLRWPECSLPPEDPAESPRYHASGSYTGYKTPYPLSEKDFLVSARGADGKFRLYLMDVDGNRELLYEGAHNIWHAIPVRPRCVPHRRPDLVAWPGTGADRRPAELGTFFSPDVYEGVPELPRGSAKHLRVIELDHKTYSTWAKTFRHSGPPVSIVQEDGVKRILSIVPVEADGSVHFEAPPGRSLYFQLLDEDFRCLQTMRSFTGLMPGETRGCLGCHELRSIAPPPPGRAVGGSAVPLALRRA
ncbi:MAG: HzsA-related protein, partial [Planctomycetota bacterium]